MSDDPKKKLTESLKSPEAIDALLEVAGAKRGPNKNVFRALYYLMVVLALAVIGIGSEVALATGYAGRANYTVGLFYFGAAILLLVLAIYFFDKSK
ncbi:MAG TPA: hypothetical protein VHQ86_01460 [Candidatus Saccharimonadia bacterium]|jgi:hypothetical protein|nr:hypothetical protein [Candidatus Saccharimonadia bacterium]